MILLRLILLHKMRHHQKPRPVYDRRKALGINTGIDGHGLLSSLDRKCSNLAHYLSYIQNCICTGMTLLCEYIIITRCAQFNNVINNLAKLCMCSFIWVNCFCISILSAVILPKTFTEPQTNNATEFILIFCIPIY